MPDITFTIDAAKALELVDAMKELLGDKEGATPQQIVKFHTLRFWRDIHRQHKKREALKRHVESIGVDDTLGS